MRLHEGSPAAPGPVRVERHVVVTHAGGGRRQPCERRGDGRTGLGLPRAILWSESQHPGPGVLHLDDSFVCQDRIGEEDDVPGAAHGAHELAVRLITRPPILAVHESFTGVLLQEQHIDRHCPRAATRDEVDDGRMYGARPGPPTRQLRVSQPAYRTLVNLDKDDVLARGFGPRGHAQPQIVSLQLDRLEELGTAQPERDQPGAHTNRRPGRDATQHWRTGNHQLGRPIVMRELASVQPRHSGAAPSGRATRRAAHRWACRNRRDPRPLPWHTTCLC